MTLEEPIYDTGSTTEVENYLLIQFMQPSHDVQGQVHEVSNVISLSENTTAKHEGNNVTQY